MKDRFLAMHWYDRLTVVLGMIISPFGLYFAYFNLTAGNAIGAAFFIVVTSLALVGNVMKLRRSNG
jgi:hypothetical protein